MKVSQVKALFSAYIQDAKMISLYQIWLGVKFKKDLTLYEGVQLTFKQKELYSKLAGEIPQILHRRVLVEKMILSIDNQEAREILTDRYINGLAWSLVASKHMYSESHIYKLHLDALKEIANLYTDECCQQVNK